MSSPPDTEVFIRGGSSVSPGVLDRPGTTPEDTEGPYIENAKKTAVQPSENMPKVLSFQQTDAIATQSIWYKYMETAEQWDRRTMEKWKTNMDNLLIFAALFTSIVTAFVLDAMSDLDTMSHSDQPSSIQTVNTLWFMSIISSLAATTWAILCLEWCAFLSEGDQAEDYEEMAEKRQRKFEAMQRWRMRFIVAAIPLFLHISLFLFLAGLWLRLRDINQQLGLIVGVSSLVLASSYVTVTLLPIFTNAPFSTSASEVVEPIVNGIKKIAQLRRFVRAPRVFTWTVTLFSAGSSSRNFTLLHYIPLPRPRRFSAFAGDVSEVVRLYIHTAWKTLALLPVLPTLVFERDPINELNKLKVGPSKRDKRIHLRALFWLMNTPLSKDEVKEILKEFKNQGCDAGEPLDRATIKLLVLSLSSILDNNDISEDEQPIFNHCTEVLAKEMDRAFSNGEPRNRRILRNNAVFEKLLPHFRLTPPAEDVPHLRPITNNEGDFWARAIPALWLCPTKGTVGSVVSRLDSTIQSLDGPLLQRIIRGLHAAILVCFDSPYCSILEDIPDFSIWDWDSTPSNEGLNETLLSFLQDLFAAFFETCARTEQPTTTPSLIAECLSIFDDQPERYSLKMHTALSFFTVVTWRCDPQVFEEDPPLSAALLKSTEQYEKTNGEELHRTQILATRFRAIVYGPKPSPSRQSRFLTRLGNLYTELPGYMKADGHFLKNLLDAHAATLEATLEADGHFAIFNWKHSSDYETMRKLFTSPLFTSDVVFGLLKTDPNYRLPYLYSLAIALTYSTDGRNQELWAVAKLLVTREEQKGITIDRALDTNILVVAILKFAVLNQSETERHGQTEAFISLLSETFRSGADWRTHWKSIYLTASIAFLLSKMDSQHEILQFLIESANETFEQVKFEPLPSDWKKKKKGLKLCNLDSKIKNLGEKDEGVYEWSNRENVPYLALYNLRHTPREPVSRAAYWTARKLQRFLTNHPLPEEPLDDSSSTSEAPGAPRITRTNDSRV